MTLALLALLTACGHTTAKSTASPTPSASVSPSPTAPTTTPGAASPAPVGGGAPATSRAQVPNSPLPQAVNANPWGYNFECCNLISSPPDGFCNYFLCSPDFASGNGYVVQCKDGTYNRFGGQAAACASRGGVNQTLKAP